MEKLFYFLLVIAIMAAIFFLSISEDKSARKLAWILIILLGIGSVFFGLG